jgi:hypothetical protein
MDYQANLLLQYYIFVVFPPTWQRVACVRSLQSFHLEIANRETMQYHMSSGLHIVTLLASMASRMKHLDKRRVQSGNSYFINRALVAVGKHLSNTTTISVDDYGAFGTSSKLN